MTVMAKYWEIEMKLLQPKIALFPIYPGQFHRKVYFLPSTQGFGLITQRTGTRSLYLAKIQEKYKIGDFDQSYKKRQEAKESSASPDNLFSGKLHIRSLAALSL